MLEAILAKVGATMLDALKWAWVAIMALLLYIFRRQNQKVDDHDEKLEKVIKDVDILQKTVIYRSDLDAKADEIKAEVREEHQRIIDEQKESNKVMRDELITCNQNVMAHIASLATDVREMRTMMMNIMERRQGPR